MVAVAIVHYSPEDIAVGGMGEGEAIEFVNDRSSFIVDLFACGQEIG